MKRLLLAALAALGSAPALAADLPAKTATPIATAPSAPPSPFFIGLNAGIGWANQQYSGFTIPGDVSGNFYPTGGLAGLTGGVGATFGGIYAELYATVDYTFARASQSGVDTTGNPFTAVSKNGLELQQGIFLGAAVPTISGAFPVHTTLPPSNSWPIPVALPTSMNGLSNVVIGPEGGVVERRVSACVDGAATSLCADRWLTGPYIGGQIQVALTPNSKLRISYDHEFFNSAWTQTGGAAVLGQFRVINADEARIGWTYNF